MKIPFPEFLKRFRKAVAQARKWPIEIADDGNREVVSTSGDYNAWLAAATRRSGYTADAPDFIIEAVRNARMDSASLKNS